MIPTTWRYHEIPGLFSFEFFSVMGLAVMVISLRGLGHPQQDKATDTETGGTGDGERL